MVSRGQLTVGALLVALVAAVLVALSAGPAGRTALTAASSAPPAAPVTVTEAPPASPATTAPAPSPSRTASTAPTHAATSPLPHIVQRPIPYSQRRKDEMAAYALAHYGTRTWRLHPRAVVLHFTDGDSASGAIGLFEQDVPNMGVLPGVCAHFVVDQDGTVYQLVPTTVMCRHVLGLNDSAIGIEVVQGTHGHSSAWADQQILDRTRQARALLLLVAMLQRQYGIGVSHIYGHATANSAPEFHDRLGWTNTHTDWGPAAVSEFRARLRRLTSTT